MKRDGGDGGDGVGWGGGGGQADLPCTIASVLVSTATSLDSHNSTAQQCTPHNTALYITEELISAMKNSRITTVIHLLYGN
jgi:hypothetical protein